MFTRSNFKYALLLILLSPFSVRAQNKIGNGGNVIDCKNGKTQLLDFFEASVSPPSTATEAFAEAAQVLENLKKFSEPLSKQYLNRLKTMKTDIEWTQDKELTAIPDSWHLQKPLDPQCSVKQIAIRRWILTENEKPFLIREDLWKKMSIVDQAGLLTHEIIYEHFKKLGEENSIKARKINALIYSDNLTAKKFWTMITDLQLPLYP